MKPMTFPGSYADQHGVENVTWVVQSSTAPGWERRFEVRTTVRGVEVWGGDFDGLSPDDESQEVRELVNLDASGSLSECVLGGLLPCHIEIEGVRHETVVRFELDLRAGPAHPPSNPKDLQLSVDVDDVTVTVVDDWLEDGVLRLEKELPDTTSLSCCVTCLYSDYSPGGHGLMGMSCHRDAKTEYLAVRSKTDYWKVPVTEDVPETYLCPEYQRRIPGTGYRG
jgi:hypothetical protein